MDGSRFDTWTRRKFGLATGGAALAGIVRLAGVGDAEARRNRKKRRPKRCRKLQQSCDNTVRSRSCCNSRHLCAQVSQLGSGTFCCLQAGEFCDQHADCCGNDNCDFNTGRCRIP